MAHVSSARVRMLVLVAIGSFSLEEVALAQRAPQAEISGSYQEVLDTSLSWSGMRREAGARGWALDVAIPVSRRLSLVGAIDWSYGEATTPASVPWGSTVISSWTDRTYLGGVRFGSSAPSRITPFLQVLAGTLRSSQKEKHETTVAAGPYTDSNEIFLVNVGAGVNVTITPRLGVRLGGDLRLDPVGMAMHGDDTAMARVVAGMVLRIP